MAGEVIASNIAFYRQLDYKIIESKTRVDLKASAGEGYYYGWGHSGGVAGYSQDGVIGWDRFDIYIYYRTSNSGSWQLSNGRRVDDGENEIVGCQSKHSHYLRWMGRLSIPDDHVAFMGFNFYTQTMRAILNTDYYHGKGLRVGMMSYGGANPAYTTGTKITKSSFLMYKPTTSGYTQ